MILDTQRNVGKARRLDPSDPDAIKLDGLYQALRASHGREVKVQRAWDARRRGDNDQLWESVVETSRARREAYHELIRAIVEIHGGGKIEFEKWLCYGTAQRAVRVGDRVYAVVADEDAGWTFDPEDDGRLILAVVEV